MKEISPLLRKQLLSTGKADRLPYNPNLTYGAARLYGCTVGELNRNPQALAMSQWKVYQHFGVDLLRISTDLYPIAEAMGVRLLHTEDALPQWLEPSVTSNKDIMGLSIPNPYHSGRLPLLLEAMGVLKEKAGQEVEVTGGVVGAFTNAALIMGVPTFLLDLKQQPDRIRELLRVSFGAVAAFTEAMLKMGVRPVISEPMASCSVITSTEFHSFVLPYLRSLVTLCESYQLPPILHICGQSKALWKEVGSLNLAGFSIDQLESLRECKAVLGGTTPIMGNLDPYKVLCNGSPQEVRQQTLKCVLEAYDTPRGYTVMAGCSLPLETPLANIEAIRHTLNEVGYPVEKEKVEFLCKI